MWGVPDYLRLHASGQPHRLACVELATGRRWTYRELEDSVARCVSVLRELAVGAGDRVAVLARNSVWQLVLQQALARAGAIFVPLNWRLAPAEVDPLLDDCDPSLLVVDETTGSLVAACAWAGPQLALSELARLIEAAPAAAAPLEADADRPSIILYTSGTSGRSKGVVVTERNAFFTACNFSVLGRVDNSSTFLCDSPMFHVIGLLTSFRPPLMQGGTMLVSAGFDPEFTFQRLSDPALAVTHYFCVPQMAQMLRNAHGFEPDRLSHLRALFTGGAPNPAENIHRWLDEGVRMVDGYGMTEAGTVLGMPLEPERIREKAGSAGLPAPTLALRLVYDDGSEVEPGEVGELQLRGPNVTPGYWRRPDENVAAFTEDGWFRTGDLGRRDPEGFVTLVDRKKDMFISGGENVYPAEVERVLLLHPQVREAAVVGVPDERWGEVGCAFLVADVAEGSGMEWLERHCSGSLARYKVPKRFILVEALPRTGSGKVRKHELKDRGHRG
jgi:fatty-acyl-CoA synthase